MMSDNALLKDKFNLTLWLKEDSVGILDFIVTGIKRLKDIWINVIPPRSINPGITNCRNKNVIWCADGIQVALHKKCSYSKLFWSAFSCTESGEVPRI